MKSHHVLYLWLLASSCGKPAKNQDETLAPNIIVILADDLGYLDVGFNGGQNILTPSIDRIASKGVVFTNGYVSYSVCGPSRAGLITGRYQDRFGFSRNPLFAPKDINQGLPLSEQTLAEALSDAGYHNMAIGKWHLGAHEKLRPLQRGFHEFFGFLSGGHQYFSELWTLNDISEVKSQFDAYNTKILRNNSRIEEKEYLTEALSREAVEFVKRSNEQPFFLYLAYNAPHGPLQATTKYIERYSHLKNHKRRKYAAMVSAMDDGIGQLLDQLEASNKIENTLIFFLSDNGGAENHGANNGTLKKGKGSLFEGGIRVPFAFQWQAKIPGGVKYNHPVISLDIFATVMEAVGTKSNHTLDGISLLPYLKGDSSKAPHEALYWRKFDKRTLAIRQGNDKIINESGHPEYFNLSTDREEKQPLADETTISQLREKYDAWDAKNIDPVFLGLMQNNQYSKLNEHRYTDLEKY